MFKTLPQCQKKKKIDWRNSSFCASFVKCKYGCKNDVIHLKWLLPEEGIDSLILKLVYNNGINKENMPAYLKLELKNPTRALRNNLPKIIAKDKKHEQVSIHEEANEMFKELPSNIKQEICTLSSYSFKDKLKNYMLDHSHKKQIVWKHEPNRPFYALMLRTKLY